MALDFQKIELRKNNVLDLKKKSGLDVNSKAQVVLALDYSGSMGGLYGNGTVQDVVERILPFGLAFDDNGEVDFYLFHDGVIKLKEPITLNNLDGHIQNKIIGKHYMGGTNYAPVLNQIYEDYATETTRKLFGSSKTEKRTDLPVYVIFITDGNNFDKNATESIIKKMSKTGIFVQFIGIGHEQFHFLDKLDDLSGRLIDNVNFLKVDRIREISDDDLYQGLMAEYPGWTQLAKQHYLID